jgi:hypothetical protein
LSVPREVPLGHDVLKQKAADPPAEQTLVSHG